MLWKVLDYIQQGGWIMIPLGLCSIAVWFLIGERLLAYHALTTGDLKMGLAIRAIQGEKIDLSGGGLRARLVDYYLQHRVGDYEIDKHILQQSAMRLRPYLTRFIALIAVLAAIAPLLGLLGTVIGMIETFNVISVFGTGNAKALAGGISVALITTQSGLLVAIPGLLVSAALARRSSQLMRSLDETTLVLQHRLRGEVQPQ